MDRTNDGARVVAEVLIRLLRDYSGGTWNAEEIGDVWWLRPLRTHPYGSGAHQQCPQHRFRISPAGVAGGAALEICILDYYVPRALLLHMAEVIYSQFGSVMHIEQNNAAPRPGTGASRQGDVGDRREPGANEKNFTARGRFLELITSRGRISFGLEA